MEEKEYIMIESVKKQHLKNLIVIALADGKMDEIEKEFLLEKSLIFGFTREEIDQTISRAENIKIEIQNNRDDKEEQLADAVLMAIIDGKIHEKEIEYIREMASILEFPENYIDHIIRRSEKLWDESR